MTNRLLFPILLLFSLLTANAQTEQRYFPYPEIPDELITLQERSDYLLDHFWDKCNLESAFSNKAEMATAFDHYCTFIPLGSREKAIASITSLLKKLEKQPADLVFVAQLAEKNFYSDSTNVVSDEAFLPFATAVAINKKADKANKLRFARLANILRNNLEGETVNDLPYTTSDGRASSLAADSATITLIYFNDPDCEDCRLARARLDANLTANKLIESGDLKIIAITPDEATPEWVEAVKSYPEKWDVTAMPNAYDLLDIRHVPSFYILDNEHRIRYKNVGIDYIINLLSRI
ncbi:MAG: DUF5106 domain-containing protein [Bacteroides sp.]|nr:DUF5106 domain-containing protein [Bacteroides sp.]